MKDRHYKLIHEVIEDTKFTNNYVRARTELSFDELRYIGSDEDNKNIKYQLNSKLIEDYLDNFKNDKLLCEVVENQKFRYDKELFIFDTRSMRDFIISILNRNEYER